MSQDHNSWQTLSASRIWWRSLILVGRNFIRVSFNCWALCAQQLRDGAAMFLCWAQHKIIHSLNRQESDLSSGSCRDLRARKRSPKYVNTISIFAAHVHLILFFFSLHKEDGQTYTARRKICFLFFSSGDDDRWHLNYRAQLGSHLSYYYISGLKHCSLWL